MLKVQSLIMTALMVLICSVASVGDLSAQVKKKSQTLTAAAKTIKLPVCTEYVPKMQLYYQSLADKGCETKTACVKCKIKGAKEPVLVSIIAQPKGKCKNTVKTIKDTGGNTNPGDNGQDFPDSPDFSQFEVLQSVCKNGGTNLEVYVPGTDFENPDWINKQYSFLWEVDGKKAGHEAAISCACGTEATVRVTQSATGRRVVKKIVLNGCAEGTKRNKAKSNNTSKN